VTAREQRRGTGPAIVDPAVVRQILDHADRSSYAAAAARHGVSVRSITRWQQRRRAAAAAGAVWPSDADVTAWHQRQPTRVSCRRRTQRWRVRRLAEGPLLIDATGTARRLQALAALGHRYEDVAALLQVGKSRARDLTVRHGDLVHRDTAAAVAAVYDELSMVLGPSSRSRVLAANRGWPPPLAWDDDAIDDPAAGPHLGAASKRADDAVDEVAVHRATGGERIPLRPVESRAAVQRLSSARMSAAQIAERLNTTPRAVQRHRQTTRRSA